jgi:hypothetical protein
MVALHVFDYEEIFISSVAAVCASTTFWLFFDEEADKYNSKTNKIIEGLRENRLKTSIISMAEEKNAAIENAKKIQI